MIIVYLSIALAVVAIVFLCVSTIKTFKRMNPSIKSMSKSAAGVHKQFDGIQKEVDHLKNTAGTFIERIEEGKRSVQNIADEGKSIMGALQSFWEMARTVPNPKPVKKAELSPAVDRINDSLLNLYEFWRRRTEN